MTRKAVGRRQSSGPSPITSDARASSHEMNVACGPMLAASAVRRCAYHAGSPAPAPAICEPMAPSARLAGRSHRKAERVQNPLQAARAALTPRGPRRAGRRCDPDGVLVPAAPGGPHQEPDDRVEQHRSGSTGEWRRHRHEQLAESLTEPPHPEGPHRHDDDGRFHGPPEQQAHPDEELDGAEEEVPHTHVGQHEVAHRGDRPGQRGRLPLSIRQQDVGDEAAPEHAGLELQEAIEDPDPPEGDLHRPGCQSTTPTIPLLTAVDAAVHRWRCAL